MALEVTAIKSRQMTNGDEAHRVEFKNGDVAQFHFNGGPIKLTQAGQKPVEVNWDVDTWDAGENKHWNAIQEEYNRMNQERDEPLEMTDAEYNEWKEAMTNSN